MYVVENKNERIVGSREEIDLVSNIYTSSSWLAWIKCVSIGPEQNEHSTGSREVHNSAIDIPYLCQSTINDNIISRLQVDGYDKQVASPIMVKYGYTLYLLSLSYYIIL